MTFHPLGDSALLINFGQKIDFYINEAVINLSKMIEACEWDEVAFLIPAYSSLTIGFNNELISFDGFVKKIKQLEKKGLTTFDTERRMLKIPVCYDEEFALDMQEVQGKTGLTKKEVIAVHSSHSYHVYMLGFIPGFAYMGILPDQIFCNRKEVPRLKIPERSVAIAGNQTGVYPLDAPGGWQIIGKTPLKVFDGKKAQPFLFQAGDTVKFEPIDMSTYKKMEGKN